MHEAILLTLSNLNNMNLIGATYIRASKLSSYVS